MESDKRNYGILNDLKLNSVIKKKYILIKHRSGGQQELKPSMTKFNMAVLVWM